MMNPIKPRYQTFSDKKISLPNDWKTNKLGNLANVFSGGTPSRDHPEYYFGDIPWIKSGELNQRYVRWTEEKITKDGLTKSSAKLIQPETLLMALYGATSGIVAIAKISAAINQAVLAIKPSLHILNSEFLFQFLEYARPQILAIYQQGGQPNLSGEIVKSLQIPLPPINEQVEIAHILSTWDRATERVQRLIGAKQRQKDQLVSQLLSGQKRFPGFQDEWKQMKLGTFLHPKLRKVVKPAGAYLRLGIRSHGKGTFTSVVDDPETIALTHLFQACKGDLIVNITFAWEGAIALVGPDGDGALVSHRFPTYVFDTSKMLPEYFTHLMVTDRFFYELDLISPGGAGRNRVMNKGDLLKIAVTVPDIEEQKKIAGVLGWMDEQIALLKKYLEKLKEQKKGLMQKLLTGEIRVKVD